MMPLTFSNANKSPLAAVVPLTGVRNSSINKLSSSSACKARSAEASHPLLGV
jgi:hypothetical protein